MRLPAPIVRSLLISLLGLGACATVQGTEPPPDGWANHAPTVVDRVIDQDEAQFLQVSQGEVRTWVRVPDVDAEIGDHVLLGRGSLRTDVMLPGSVERVRELVDIEHVQVVDRATAEAATRATTPAEAVAIGTVYAELDARKDAPIVVHGTVVKAPHAVGAYWVHLQDGSGDAAAGTHDLTVKTTQAVTVGQRVSFEGVLRQDVDLGFGYHYAALVEDGARVP